MNEAKKQRIVFLVRAIWAFLEQNRDRSKEADLVLAKMWETDLSLDGVADLAPCGGPHSEVLTDAIDDIVCPDVRNIAKRLKDARHDLVWREDDGRYYPVGADMGEGYRNCNLHTVLIGPGACGFEAEGFSLGLFMLGPRTLYRDHAHDAPELYVNLSPRSGWRLPNAPWRDYEAGSIIWNGSGAVHATRTYDHAFLSVFAWLEDVGTGYRVVPFPDWLEIEQSLSEGKL